MADSDSLVTPDPVPPPADPAILLPPAPPAPAHQEVEPPHLLGLDRPLVAIVLLLAFLLASFPIANSSFFGQLAVGRLVSQGHYPFGANPFVFSLDGVYWVNHSWLFGLFIYLLYQVPASGVVLVVVKALLVTLVAEIMLRCAVRPGQSLWAPALCTGLAVVTLSPYLSLTPQCASYLGLALVVWLLARSRSHPRAAWLIPPLCLLWVNLDAWFWLGPLLVALHLVGELLQRSTEVQKRETSRRLLGVLGASLAACLVNPYFPTPWRVFELPPELTPSAFQSGLREDEQFRSFFLSPCQSDYLFDAHAGLSVAGLAYFVLLLAGLASFVLDYRRFSLGRLLPWLVFALLSLWNVHLIPFFAIVAGPITAQGFLSWSETLSPTWTRAWRYGALAGRGLSLLVGVLLLVAAVPGWLQALPHREHHVGWGVERNPSLEAAVRQIKEWHESGKLSPGERWVSLTPEVAHYLAWDCPGERAWIDDSVLESPEAAEDYLEVRQALLPSTPAVDRKTYEEAETRWEDFFRAHNARLVIHHMIGAGLGQRRLLDRLLGQPAIWAPCHLEGSASIFAWRDQQTSWWQEEWWQEQKLLASLTLNVPSQAFGSGTSPAPLQGPEQDPAAVPWWQELWSLPPSPSLDLGTASLHDLRFTALGPAVAVRHDQQWRAMVPVSAIGAAALTGPLSPATLQALGWSYAYQDHPLGAPLPQTPLHPLEQVALQLRFVLRPTQDQGPVSSLYLGIRAARRALTINPDDPYPYLLLGRAYYRLGWYTREHYLAQGMPALQELRMAQTTAALSTVLRLRPRLPTREYLAQELEAHQMLAELFERQKLLDVQTEHRRGELECARALGPLPGEGQDRHAARLQQLEKMVTQLEDQLNRNENLFQVQSARRALPERVQRALSLGLLKTAYQAIEKDLEEHPEQRGPMLILEAARLKLQMGQIQDARDLLQPSIEGSSIQPLLVANSGPFVELAAAHGDYEEADQFLEQRLQGLSRDLSIEQIGYLMASALLAEAPLAAGMPWQQYRRLPTLNALLPADMATLASCRIALESLQGRAESHFFRGLMALEAGQMDQARQQLRLAEDHLVPIAHWGPAISRLGLRQREEMERLQQVATRQESLRSLTQLCLGWITQAQ